MTIDMDAQITDRQLDMQDDLHVMDKAIRDAMSNLELANNQALLVIDRFEHLYEHASMLVQSSERDEILKVLAGLSAQAQVIRNTASVAMEVFSSTESVNMLIQGLNRVIALMEYDEDGSC